MRDDPEYERQLPPAKNRSVTIPRQGHPRARTSTPKKAAGSRSISGCAWRVPHRDVTGGNAPTRLRWPNKRPVFVGSIGVAGCRHRREKAMAAPARSEGVTAARKGEAGAEKSPP